MSEKNGKEVKNRNASPSAYGWAFQVGAGIKLMLENITEFTALKMEGKDDDIELTLSSGKIYAQAKSVTQMGDQSSATERLKEALATLTDDYIKNKDSIKLIYITNILNPFSSSRIPSPYYSCYDTSYDYSTLPPEDRQKITDIVGDDFPVDQLQVHVVRFFGEGKNKFDGIKEYIKSFSRKVFDDTSYCDLLFEKWCALFLANAADVPKEGLSLAMSKKEALYPVIVLAICRKGALITINDTEFDLPVDELAVRTLLFDITNYDLLNNLLGTIYFDQEKGWTLLNRGTIIFDCNAGKSR